MKYIFIAKDIFKLYLIPGDQILGYPQSYGSHVGPSDVNFSGLSQFSGVHLIILLFATYALIRINLDKAI